MENMNLKIARELNKIARELVAGTVANKQGKYVNFTGEIDWQNTKGYAINATFELKKSGLIWMDGTGKFSSWKNGIWYNGTWEDGTFENGTWKNGTWKGGQWKSGKWENGTWLFGYWNGGNWRNGTWIMGYDKDGNPHEKGDSPNKWNSTKKSPNLEKFAVFKKHIVDFCEQEYLRCRRFYNNCQNNFSVSTQGLECYSDLLQVILQLKEIANEAEKAKPKKK